MADVKVKFIGDNKQLNDAIDDSTKRAGGIGDRAGRAGSALTKGVTLPVLAAGTAVIGLAVKAGDTADELLDMADQTGVNTDKLQEYRYVAGQAGVNTDFYANSVDEVIKAQDKLQKGTGPAAEALDTLGVSVTNVDGSMRSAEQITDDAMKALAGIEDPTLRAALAQDVFKGSAQDLLPVLGQGTDVIDEQRKAAEELGAVQSNESLKGANAFRQGIESLQASLGGVVGALGGAFAPILNDVILPLIQDSIIPAIRKFSDWIKDLMDRFNKLSPGTKKLALTLVSVAAAAGPLLVGGAKLVGMFRRVGQAFGVLSKIFMANPWVLLIAAIVGLVVIVVKNWDKIVAAFKAAWDWIKGAATAVGDWIKGVFEGMLDWIKGVPEAVWGFLEGMWDAFNDAVTDVKDFVVDVFMAIVDWFRGLPGKVWNAIKTVWDRYIAGVRAVKDFVIGVFTSVVDWFKGYPGRVWNNLKWIWDKFKEGVTAVKDFVTGKWDAIVGFFKGMPSRITAAVSGLWDGLKTAFKGALNWIIDKWNNFKIGFNLPKIFGGGSISISTPYIKPIAFHQGGVVQTQTRGGEGLAMLQDGEKVISASASRQGGGGGGITIIVEGSVLSEGDLINKIRRSLIDIQKRNGNIGLVGV